MAEYPALPLFTDAYMADTRHLTTTQHGAYLLLLMTAWRMPDCKLPDDDKLLARWTGLDSRNWIKMRPYIIDQFWATDEDGKLYQRRLQDERKYADSVRRKNAEAGKASALKYKERHSTTVATKQQPNENPHTHTLPTPKESTVLSSNDFSKVYDYGSSIFPKLASSATYEITKWLEAGCSVEKDILPCIDRAKGKNIGAWIYFSGAIMDIKASREKPLPDGKVQNYKPMTTAEIDRQARKGAKTIL